MTGSSNFDLMPTRYVAGLIGGPVGALIGTLDGAARKARRRFRPQPARGTVRDRECDHGAAQVLGGVS
ncbi:MAG: hypothetical protein EOS34_27235 [Mesorhizobium sp.]|nr:MAG: hypothetical protein EOS34_27235 [Mesorhizobium sp.]